MHSTFENFLKQINGKYFSEHPEATAALTPNLISPFILRLPQKVLTTARGIAADLEKLFQSPHYRAQIQKDLPFDLNGVQQTPSVLSSLDVHLDQDKNLKIIEINTNASSYLVNLENYEARGISTFPQARADLKSTFAQTYAQKLNSQLNANSLFVILDENPTMQNLYVEFLMFQRFVKQEFSVDAVVADPKELTLSETGGLLYQGRAVSAIYNRFTDFYFANSPTLAEAYKKTETLISPNPLMYGVLADKKRLLLWTPEFFSDLKTAEGLELPALQSALLTAKRFGDFPSREDLWKQRSGFFFKPPNSYGGKSVYRGKTISKVVFERIYDDEYIAQQVVPAPEETFDYMGEQHTFKYDLRFYFFKGQIQLGVARIYQGQLTNLKTPLGGLTPIEFAP